MSFSILFRGVESASDVRVLQRFLLAQHLGYKGYGAWVERSMPQVVSGAKQAVLAFYGAHLVGDVVLQQHRSAPFFLEVKNLRIEKGWRGRNFAPFMLRQVEVEYMDRYCGVICDVRADRPDIVQFMESQGYTALPATPLYDCHELEIPMVKVLQPAFARQVFLGAQKIITAQAV